MIQPYMQCILKETVISEKKEEISQNGELYTSVYTTSESGKIQLRLVKMGNSIHLFARRRNQESKYFLLPISLKIVVVISFESY